jgi:hypothetical protein
MPRLLRGEQNSGLGPARSPVKPRASKEDQPTSALRVVGPCLEVVREIRFSATEALQVIDFPFAEKLVFALFGHDPRDANNE